MCHISKVNLCFSQTQVIHQVKTTNIKTMKEVGIPGFRASLLHMSPVNRAGLVFEISTRQPCLRKNFHVFICQPGQAAPIAKISVFTTEVSHMNTPAWVTVKPWPNHGQTESQVEASWKLGSLGALPSKKFSPGDLSHTISRLNMKRDAIRFYFSRSFAIVIIFI